MEESSVDKKTTTNTHTHTKKTPPKHGQLGPDIGNVKHATIYSHVTSTRVVIKDLPRGFIGAHSAKLTE